jgi:hypothetical protein
VDEKHAIAQLFWVDLIHKENMLVVSIFLRQSYLGMQHSFSNYVDKPKHHTTKEYVPLNGWASSAHIDTGVVQYLEKLFKKRP